VEALAPETLDELRVLRVGVAVLLAAEALEVLRVRRVGVAALKSLFDALEELRVLLADERVAEATDEATDCSSSD
jgi:hypothetical protein